MKATISRDTSRLVLSTLHQHTRIFQSSRVQWMQSHETNRTADGTQVGPNLTTFTYVVHKKVRAAWTRTPTYRPNSLFNTARLLFVPYPIHRTPCKKMANRPEYILTNCTPQLRNISAPTIDSTRAKIMIYQYTMPTLRYFGPGPVHAAFHHPRSTHVPHV